MCLTVTENTRIRVNKKERVVYKIVGEINNCIYSFYQKTPIKTNTLLKIEGNLKIVYGLIRNKKVEEGFHSFKDLNHAIDVINIDLDWAVGVAHFEKIYVYKCIIPKNSKVVKGTFSDDAKVSYVSNQIIYKEICYSYEK